MNKMINHLRELLKKLLNSKSSEQETKVFLDLT